MVAGSPRELPKAGKAGEALPLHHGIICSGGACVLEVGMVRKQAALFHDRGYRLPHYLCGREPTPPLSA